MEGKPKHNSESKRLANEFKEKYKDPRYSSKFDSVDEVEKEMAFVQHNLENMSGNEIPHAKAYLSKLEEKLRDLKNSQNDNPFASLADLKGKLDDDSKAA